MNKLNLQIALALFLASPLIFPSPTPLSTASVSEPLPIKLMSWIWNRTGKVVDSNFEAVIFTLNYQLGPMPEDVWVPVGATRSAGLLQSSLKGLSYSIRDPKGKLIETGEAESAWNITSPNSESGLMKIRAGEEITFCLTVFFKPEKSGEYILEPNGIYWLTKKEDFHSEPLPKEKFRIGPVFIRIP
ncbi:MAG TPA: hypothetical protein VFA52_00545 [Candidatus Paceibacterota bacterium]|nr:hypothetical protein [Candidatus Paceibacterota bacterium]